LLSSHMQGTGLILIAVLKWVTLTFKGISKDGLPGIPVTTHP
jgi:hypothetical protein